MHYWRAAACAGPGYVVSSWSHSCVFRRIRYHNQMLGSNTYRSDCSGGNVCVTCQLLGEAWNTWVPRQSHVSLWFSYAGYEFLSDCDERTISNILRRLMLQSCSLTQMQPMKALPVTL